jgi:hypothetical protein
MISSIAHAVSLRVRAAPLISRDKSADHDVGALVVAGAAAPRSITG